LETPDDTAGCPGCRHLDRRTFLAESTLAAVATLLAACGVGGSTGPGSGLPLTVKVSDYPVLATVGGMARVDTGSGIPVAAVRATETSFAAFSLICPHQGFLVNINGGTSFLCSGHGARFNAAGQWTGGQPTGNLTSLSASFDQVAGTLVIG
jgi:Rieske Fe-S protein